MDKLVSLIQALSSTEQDLKQLKNTLSKEEGALAKNLPVLDEALNVLDPAVHSLGYVFILAAKVGSQKIDPQKFLQQVQRFLTVCNGAQIRFAPKQVAVVCRRFKELAVEGNQALRAIKPLRWAVTKLRPGSESLTPVHADFLQVCLLAKYYSAALPILDTEIYDVNVEVTTVTPRDMLLYYYYGGLIYAGLKEYSKALGGYGSCSGIKRNHGGGLQKIYAAVFTGSWEVQRYHKTSFPQYLEFATAFSTQSTDDLHKCAEMHAEIFHKVKSGIVKLIPKDKNFGLVKQCIQSLYSKNIQRHTQTYLTFSLQDMAASVKLSAGAEAEKHVLRMIEKGEIFATINQKDGMVSFQEDPEQYDTKNMTTHLDTQIQKVIELGQKVRAIDESIASSAHYIQRTTVHERGRWGEYGEGEFEGVEKALGGPGKLM